MSLDPLGFAVDQVDSLFLVLGTMISRLTPTPGERQLQILLQFMRLCFAVLFYSFSPLSVAKC